MIGLRAVLMKTMHSSFIRNQIKSPRPIFLVICKAQINGKLNEIIIPNHIPGRKPLHLVEQFNSPCVTKLMGRLRNFLNFQFTIIKSKQSPLTLSHHRRKILFCWSIKSLSRRQFKEIDKTSKQSGHTFTQFLLT
jgi:hypothetical protein